MGSHADRAHSGSVKKRNGSPQGGTLLLFFVVPAVSKMNHEAITHSLERECDVLPSTQTISTSFVGEEIRKQSPWMFGMSIVTQLVMFR